MFLIRNAVDFEAQLRGAISKRDALGDFPEEYLAGINLLEIKAGFAIVRVPRFGQLGRHIFAHWLMDDFQPLLLQAFENRGEPMEFTFRFTEEGEHEGSRYLDGAVGAAARAIRRIPGNLPSPHAG